MTIEQAVCERLLSLGAVTALVGQRVFQLILRQGSPLPAIVVQRIGGGDDYHLRGRTNLFEARVQVDVYADALSLSPYVTASNVAAAVNGDGLGASATGLSGFLGSVGGSPPAIDILIMRCLDSGRPDYVAEEKRQVRLMLEYMVQWKEA